MKQQRSRTGPFGLDALAHPADDERAPGDHQLLLKAVSIPVRALGERIESKAGNCGSPSTPFPAAKACARSLIDRGLRRVIITLGEKGALLATKHGEEAMPGFKVAPKDTTGAGDAFIGSFAVFLAEGLPERDAILRANLYAAL